VRPVRILGISLVAVCALVALSATSASAALPEWGRCLKVPVTIKGKEHKKGAYANANCTEKTGGEYEWAKGTSELLGTYFTNTMTSPEAHLMSTDGLGVNCKGQTAEGRLSGTKEVSELRVTFTGCETNVLNFASENEFTHNVKVEEETGQLSYEYIEGEIETHYLKGKLGYISGKGTANPVVGLELEPEEKHGLFAAFGCGSKAPHVTPVIFSNVGENPFGGKGDDAIISPISPVNQMGKETTQVYSMKKVENPETKALENVPGIQEPTSFENGKPAFLENINYKLNSEGEWAQSAQEETTVTKLNDSEEEIEIKA
jgi:hypothetical protein